LLPVSIGIVSQTRSNLDWVSRNLGKPAVDLEDKEALAALLRREKLDELARLSEDFEGGYR
jgi:hypothetical protein